MFYLKRRDYNNLYILFVYWIFNWKIIKENIQFINNLLNISHTPTHTQTDTPTYISLFLLLLVFFRAFLLLLEDTRSIKA